MIITAISLWHAPLASHTPYYMSDGKSCDTVETVIVRLDTDQGMSGWGEVCPIPHYLPAYANGVVPDLCTLGKVIGGGLPLAAIAGRADIMAHFDMAQAGESGFTLQIGTLSGNPLAAAAGLKTMEVLRRPGSYERLRRNGETLMAALAEHLSSTGIDHQIVGDPVLFDVVFTADPVRDYRGVFRGDAGLAKRFNALLRENGIFKSDGKMYPSLALTDGDIARTVEAIASAARNLH